MTRWRRRSFAALAGAGLLSLAAAIVDGCASTACSETATCPDPIEAAVGGSADAADERAGGDESHADDLGDAARPQEASANEAAQDAEEGVPDASTSAEDATRAAEGGSSMDAQESSTTGTREAGRDTSSDACVPTGPEICNNGVDDDCNGLTDCADLVACSAFACAQRVPPGWTGPALFWTGPYPASQVPACPMGFQPLDAFQGLTAPSDTCSCACLPTGQQCSPTAVAYIDQACTSRCTTVAPPGTGVCTPLPANFCGSNGSFAVTGTPSPGGTCTGQVTTTDGGAPSWTNTVRLCASVGATDSPGGCTSTGAQCLPDPAPFGSPCVYHSGAVASCPAGYAANGPFVVYSGATDQRACGPCSCGGPSGASCSGNTRIFAGTLCSGTGTQNAPACTGYSLSPGPGSVRATYTLTPGTCTVSSQPAPMGGVVPTGATTVCCQ